MRARTLASALVVIPLAASVAYACGYVAVRATHRFRLETWGAFVETRTSFDENRASDRALLALYRPLLNLDERWTGRPVFIQDRLDP